MSLRGIPELLITKLMIKSLPGCICSPMEWLLDELLQESHAPGDVTALIGWLWSLLNVLYQLLGIA